MLDDVVAYLDSVDARDLGAEFPVFTFDRAAASSYLTPPIELPVAGPADAAPPPNTSDQPWAPAPDLARLVRDGDITAAEVAAMYAGRVQKRRHRHFIRLLRMRP
jgi:hypothetical protein